MPSNNLRIIYKNVVDSAAVLTSNTNFSASTLSANLTVDTKSRVYRTATGSTTNLGAFIFIDLGVTNSLVVNSVVLAYTNLTSTATIRLHGSNSILSATATADSPTLSGSPSYSSASALAQPYVNSGKDYWGENNFSHLANLREGYARVYTDNTTAYRYYAVEIRDTRLATGQYLEFSRLILGEYWSPKYNTSYGLSKSTKSLSTTDRTESGDLITTIRPSYDSLSFDMKYLDAADRSRLQRIIKHNGVNKSLFVSLFPENMEDYGKEQMYQLYGKLTQLFPVDHPLYQMYSSEVSIEEI